MCLHSVLLLAILGQAPATPEYVLEVRPAKRIQAELTYRVACPNLLAQEWVVYAAAAPDLPGQQETRTRMMPPGVAVKEIGPPYRSLVGTRVPARNPELARGIHIRVVYEASLRSRSLRPLKPGETPPKVPSLSEAERATALAAHGDVDFKTAGFQGWLKAEKLVRQPPETDVNFARRVFLALRKQCSYQYQGDMDRHASVVCRTKRSDCGGLSALFVSTMRANGIPARLLYGRWALSAKPGEKVGGIAYYQFHAKAEFHAAGIGWVPVDVSSSILHDKSPAGLRFFGHDPGDFLVQHVDTHFQLNTIHFGSARVHNLQKPAHWVTGGGNLKPTQVTEGWQVSTSK
jgi:transglutaminase-like putative cysteine protease